MAPSLAAGGGEIRWSRLQLGGRDGTPGLLGDHLARPPRSTAMWRTPKVTSSGGRPMKRCSVSSMTSSARSAPTSMGAGCTRRCSTGRRRPTTAACRWSLGTGRIWRGAEKVVYSRTLEAPSTARTRVEPSFDPEAVRRLKATTSHDLTIGGADLAGQALGAGLVDELQLFVVPVVIGGGKGWLPKNVHLQLELLGSSRFANGVVFLRYRPVG